MNRRKFLKKIGYAFAVTQFVNTASTKRLLGQKSHVSDSQRPNILLIMTDQQFAGAMSCAGNKNVKTPAMDSIAQNGTLFEKSYCSQPLCVPSRTSMFSGLMPHETGVTINLDEHPIHVEMMGTILSKAGYDCGYVGKWHLPISPKRKKQHGFNFVRLAGDYPPDRDIPCASVDFIREKRKQPFLLVASFVNPHDICEWARGEVGKEGLIPDAPSPDQCPALPDNFDIPANEPDIIRKIQSKSYRTYPTAKWNENKWRRYRWAYYRFIEKVDAQIGVILSKLRELGQEKNTVIIFTSDHGDGMGAHHWNQKQVLYEESVRVPFIVSLKGVTKPGYVDRNHLVSTGLDLIPTMCDYAGITSPENLHGKSVRALAERHHSAPWRDFLVTETEFCSWGESYNITGRMLRGRRYKYIVYSEGKRREQLIDMQTDPGEMINLAKDPKYRDVLLEHRRLLAAWCKEKNDPFKMSLKVK